MAARRLLKKNLLKRVSEMVATQEELRGEEPKVPVDHYLGSSWLQISQKIVVARHYSLMP